MPSLVTPKWANSRLICMDLASLKEVKPGVQEEIAAMEFTSNVSCTLSGLRHNSGRQLVLTKCDVNRHRPSAERQF